MEYYLTPEHPEDYAYESMLSSGNSLEEKVSYAQRKTPNNIFRKAGLYASAALLAITTSLSAVTGCANIKLDNNKDTASDSGTYDSGTDTDTYSDADVDSDTDADTDTDIDTDIDTDTDTDTDSDTDTDTGTGTMTDTGTASDTGTETNTDTTTGIDTDTYVCPGITQPTISSIVGDIEGIVGQTFNATVVVSGLESDGKVILNLSGESDPYVSDVECTLSSGDEYDCSFTPDTPGFYYNSIIATAYNPCFHDYETFSDQLTLEEDIIIHDTCVDDTAETQVQLYDGAEPGEVFEIYWMQWHNDVLDNLDNCPDTYAYTDILDNLDDCFGMVTSEGWDAEYTEEETPWNFLIAETESFYFVGRQVSANESAHYISEDYPNSSFFERIEIPEEFWIALTHCNEIPY